MARLQSEMSFESPDNEKNFPVSEEDHEKQSKKKELGKKKESKKEKKDKGYVIFDEEDSEEEPVIAEDVKSPKSKKGKPFTFLGSKKELFLKGKEKEEKKEKEGKKEEKEKKKDEKEGKKHKSKEKKKPKHHVIEIPQITQGDSDKPVFGVPLAVAVERNKSHDGIELPALFRECISYIEEHGLLCEGIYRISGVKSKVQLLKDCYNKGVPVYLEEHEPNIVASLLKQYLRELPEPVLTTVLTPKFEEASTVKNEKKQIEQFQKLINDLPTCNRLLLCWMIIHMKHVIERQKDNKMSLQNVSIVLSPTMQISHRVLNVLFCHANKLFKNVTLKKYKPPIKPATSRWSLELPDNQMALEEELAKQESLLNQLHAELNTGIVDPTKEEQLWEVQRVVTGLKRKIKLAKKAIEAAEKRKREKEQKRTSVLEEGEEELRLELQEMPDQPQESQDTQNVLEEDSSVKKDMEKDSETGKDNVVAAVEIPGTVDSKLSEEAPESDKKETVPTSENENETVDKDQVTMAEIAEQAKPDIDADDEFEQKVEEILEGQAAREEVLDDEEEREVKEEEKEDPVKKEEMKEEEKEVRKGEEFGTEDVMEKDKDIEVEEIDVCDIKSATEKKETDQNSENVTKPDDLDKSDSDTSDEEIHVEITDEDYTKMLLEEKRLLLEEEELLAIEDELRKKIETEQSEIGRLDQEIAELQYLRQDSDLEEMSSSSDSSYESEDEEELQDILNKLIAGNENLEKHNAELCQKIHEERMNCLAVKVEIRVLHQNSGHNTSMI